LFRLFARLLQKPQLRSDEDLAAIDFPIADTKNFFSDVEWKLMLRDILVAEEACVIAAIYWGSATQRQAARDCGVSQTTVRRLHRRAMVKLRAEMR